MGQQFSFPEKQGIEQKLQFCQNIQDPNFDNIDLYKLKQPTAEYVMDKTKKLIFSEDAKKQRMGKAYFEIMESLKEKKHKNLVEIYENRSTIENLYCSQYYVVHTYCNYYNFSLKDAIDRKKQRGNHFSQAELYLIMHSLVDLAVYFKSVGICYANYKQDTIFLTTDGLVKVYLLQIDKMNKNCPFYKNLQATSLISDITLSNYSDWNKSLLNPNFDMYKEDLFDISIVILQLMSREKLSFYFNQSQYNYKRIAYGLSHRYEQSYSKDFINFLRLTLNQNPAHRLSLEEAYSSLLQLTKQQSNIHQIKLDRQKARQRNPFSEIQGEKTCSTWQKKFPKKKNSASGIF